MKKNHLLDLDLENSTQDNLIAKQPQLSPRDPGGEDWLYAMEVGSVFLSQHNSQVHAINKYIYDEYYIVGKTQTSVWLFYVIANQRLRVNSLKFSRNNTMVELLGIITPPTETEVQENEHEQRDRPNQSS